MMATELLEEIQHKRFDNKNLISIFRKKYIDYQNEYPWQAGLKRIGASLPFCGGSVITNKMVLTAAHCEMSPSDFKIVLGDHRSNSLDM